MEKETNDTKKLFLGLLMAGLAGAGVLYYTHMARSKKTPLLKKIGRTLSEVGEMIENCEIGSASDVLECFEKKMPSTGDVMNQAANWINAGLNILKHLKKR